MGLEIPMAIGAGMGLLSGGGIGGALKGGALGAVGGGLNNYFKGGSFLANSGASAIPASGAAGVASVGENSIGNYLPPVKPEIGMFNTSSMTTGNPLVSPTVGSGEFLAPNMGHVNPVTSSMGDNSSLVGSNTVRDGGLNASNAPSPYGGFKLPDYVTPQNVIGAAGLLQNMQGQPQQQIQAQGAGVSKGNPQGLSVDMGGAKLIKRRGQA